MESPSTAGIAEQQRVVGDLAVLLAIALDLPAQVGAHGGKRPADVMAVDVRGDAVEIFLQEISLRLHELVARQSAGADENDQHAALRHQKKAHMLDDAAGERGRNENTEAARDGGEDMAGALHDGFSRLRGGQLSANPLAVFRAGGRLRGHLLDEEAIGRGRGNASSGGVRLIEIAFAFEIGHHVTDGCRAQRLDVARDDTARRYRLASFDIGAHDVGENLLMPLLLQDSQVGRFL